MNILILDLCNYQKYKYINNMLSFNYFNDK